MFQNMCKGMKFNCAKYFVNIFENKKVFDKIDAKIVRSATLICDTFKNHKFLNSQQNFNF